MNWKIKKYISSSGRCDVQTAYDQGSAELKAEFETALAYLKPLPRDKWIRPQVAKLDRQNKFRDFFEIRFKANNLQQRPVGFFGVADNEFTIVMWLTEKGGRLLPVEWFDTANKRRKAIIAGTATARCFTLEGEEEDECDKT